MSRDLICNYIKQLKEVQEKKIWIGENFHKKLSLINEENAFIRPLPNLHSVAEIISHLITWRKETILKLKTGDGKLTDDSEENWLSNEQLKKIGWNQLKLNYENTLIEIINILENKEDHFLGEQYYDTDFKGNYKYQFVIEGMLHHDLYHLGQLGIITKLLLSDAPG